MAYVLYSIRAGRKQVPLVELAVTTLRARYLDGNVAWSISLKYTILRVDYKMSRLSMLGD
jgi:hypothetical protein